MRTLTTTLVALAGFALVAAPASAQGHGRGRVKNDDTHGASTYASGHVPPGHMPPAGSCRVWVEGVPPGRQSPPTDCATARRMADRNGGRVIYGGGVDERTYRTDDRYVDRDPPSRCYDRDDRRVDCASRSAERCYDRDGDRVRCSSDIQMTDRDGCVDRDRDGRCDGGLFNLPRRTTDYPSGTSSRAYPSGMPLMSSAVTMRERNALTEDARRWVGDRARSVKYLDVNGDRIPEVATWYDGRNEVIQKWIGSNSSDGRANRVEIYENGKKVQTIDR